MLDSGSELLREMNRVEHHDADKYRDGLEKVSDDITQRLLIQAIADVTAKYHDRHLDHHVHLVWGRMDTLFKDLRQRGGPDEDIEQRLREVGEHIGQLEKEWPDWAACEAAAPNTEEGRYPWLIGLGWDLIADFGAAEAELDQEAAQCSLGNRLRDAENPSTPSIVDMAPWGMET